MIGYLVVFLGGGTGAVARLALGSALLRAYPSDFPWGTLAVNILGALLIGGLTEIFALRWAAPETVRMLLITGFLGGFTTFSAFSLESSLMWSRGDYGPFALYLFLSVVGTILAVFLARAMLNAIL